MNSQLNLLGILFMLRSILGVNLTQKGRLDAPPEHKVAGWHFISADGIFGCICGCAVPASSSSIKIRLRLDFPSIGFPVTMHTYMHGLLTLKGWRRAKGVTFVGNSERALGLQHRLGRARTGESRLASKTGRSETLLFVTREPVSDMTIQEDLRVFERLHTEAQFRCNRPSSTIVERMVLRHGGKIWAQKRR